MALGMPKSQREQTMVFVALIGFLAAGAYYWFVYAPQSVIVAARSAYVIDTLEAYNSLAKVQSSGSSTSEMKAQVEEYATNLQIMRQLVPTSNEVPSLLDQVSTAARRAGLDIGRVEPLGTETSTEYNFDAHRYRLMVNGNFHRIAEFLTNVGSLARIMVPLNIQMSALPPTGPRVDPNRTATTTFELHTYVARGGQ